jgi:NADH-quinone oxidoreductase subunit M
MVTLLLGGVPLLVGLLTLATAGGGFETDLTTLLASPVPAAVQAMAWPLLLLGFAVKAPVVPLHGWMPEVVAEGPAAVGVMVMGLKIGVWGLLRFVGTCPDAAVVWSGALAAAGAVGAVYGALLALRQTELRRLVAWLGTSHVGVALIALSTGTMEGLTATVALLVSFAVVTAGLLVVGGMLHDRVGSTDVSSLSALATRAPRLTTALVLLAVGGLGLPGTIGFVGEHLALLSAFQDHPMWFMAVAVTTPLGAAAWLGWGTRALGGPAERDRSPIEDLRPRETAVAYAFVLAMWAGGLAPELWTQLVEPSMAVLAGEYAAR